MKALLTGATGFIGTHMVDLLLAEGTEVHALVRNPDKESALLEKNVRLLRGDLFSIPALPAGLDAVFHLAGRTRSLSAAGYYTVNREGTASLFRSLSALQEPPKVILLSSQAAAGPSSAGRPVRESDPPHPVTPYGRSKLQGEQEALKFKDRFPVAILRACSVFGPRDRDFLPYFRLVSRGIIPTIKGGRKTSLIYVKDLARALWLSAQKSFPSGEIFNIADPSPHNWDDLGIAAAAALGRKSRRLEISRGVLYFISLLCETSYRLKGKPGLITRDKYRDLTQAAWLADVGKASELLSFRAQYPLDGAVGETISWYLAEGWL
jgi:nucleoside-diphosphate-sugar epimerase